MTRGGVAAIRSLREPCAGILARSAAVAAIALLLLTGTGGTSLPLPPNLRSSDSGSGAPAPAEIPPARLPLAALGAEPASPASPWSAVQLVFVLETTPYDGVYDPTVEDWGQLNGGPGDACSASVPGTGPLCEESNGVPFFVANASAIAARIQSANPSTNVTFALVDYSASHDGFDNRNGTEYHVDISSFVPASSFGAAVNRTFVAHVLGNGSFYQNSDLSDNLLHSASITALYETLVGNGLNWSNETHHVVVWIGSTAPRDPNYPENYCLSPSDFDQNNGSRAGSGPSCYDPTCEPASTFANGSVPACERWVVPQNSSTNNSIALLARTAPQCTRSLGENCTVDTVDLFNGVTDPLSYAWPRFQNSTGSGPGGSAVLTDSSNILRAGCDLAAATGGSWDGPNFWTCADDSTGNLSYDPIGYPATPYTSNPTLLGALGAVGLGLAQSAASFSVHIVANRTSGAAPLPVSFGTFLSNGSGSYSYAWNFGDGASAVGPTATHTFETAGTYDVTVTATDGSSAARAEVPIGVTGPSPGPLTLALELAPGTGVAPLPIVLTATPAGGLAPYHLSLCFVTGTNGSTCLAPWENVSNAAGPVERSYTYATAGAFTVTGTLSEATRTGPGANLLPAVATTSVLVSTSAPLRAVARSDSGPGSAPLAVTFQVNVSGGSAPYSLQWSFGDGEVGSSLAGRPISHVYSAAGTFVPSVRISDARGAATSIDLAVVHVSSGGGNVSSPGPGPDWSGPGPGSAALVLALVAGFVLVIGLADLRRRARWRRDGAALLSAMEDQARGSGPPPPGP